MCCDTQCLLVMDVCKQSCLLCQISLLRKFPYNYIHQHTHMIDHMKVVASVFVIIYDTTQTN